MALRVSNLNGVGLAMCSMTSDCKQQNMSQMKMQLKEAHKAISDVAQSPVQPAWKSEYITQLEQMKAQCQEREAAHK